MSRFYLTVQLLSDSTFGRGAGLAGLVDVEIEHDQNGFPFIGGRALKGLLVEEWANLRCLLDTKDWDKEAAWLFGTSGDAHAHLHVGAATLPPDLIAAIKEDIASERLTPQQVLASLTGIRRQTAINAGSGAPERASLRAMRVLLRDTDLIAPLDFDTAFPSSPEDRPSDSDTSPPTLSKERLLGLLAACALATRRGGTGRNRGRGRLKLRLHDAIPANYRDDTFTMGCFKEFADRALI